MSEIRYKWDSYYVVNALVVIRLRSALEGV